MLSQEGREIPLTSNEGKSFRITSQREKNEVLAAAPCDLWVNSSSRPQHILPRSINFSVSLMKDRTHLSQPTLHNPCLNATSWESIRDLHHKSIRVPQNVWPLGEHFNSLRPHWHWDWDLQSSWLPTLWISNLLWLPAASEDHSWFQWDRVSSFFVDLHRKYALWQPGTC